MDERRPEPEISGSGSGYSMPLRESAVSEKGSVKGMAGEGRRC